jgi:hypothetical protein
MLVKRTARNRLTLSEAAIPIFECSEYFRVTQEDGRIVLTPLSRSPGDAVRDKLARLGITEEDVDEAVEWARRG